MKLSDSTKRAIFKTLASKSQYATGLEFGFDKHFDSNVKITNAVNKVYRQVKEAPEKYALDAEILSIVEKGMEERRMSGKSVLVEQNNNVAVTRLEALPERELVLGARKKVWVLLHKKLDAMAKNKRLFNSESLMSLAKVAGITFDKGQIVSGEATEHIAMKAKIDGNITSADALGELMRFREASLSEDD